VSAGLVGWLQVVRGEQLHPEDHREVRSRKRGALTRAFPFLPQNIHVLLWRQNTLGGVTYEEAEVDREERKQEFSDRILRGWLRHRHGDQRILRHYLLELDLLGELSGLPCGLRVDDGLVEVKDQEGEPAKAFPFFPQNIHTLLRREV